MENKRNFVLKIDTKGKKQLNQVNDMVNYIAKRFKSTLKIIEKSFGSEISIDIIHDKNSNPMDYEYSLIISCEKNFYIEEEKIYEIIYRFLSEIIRNSKLKNQTKYPDEIIEDFIENLQENSCKFNELNYVPKIKINIEEIFKKLSTSSFSVSIYRLWTPGHVPMKNFSDKNEDKIEDRGLGNKKDKTYIPSQMSFDEKVIEERSDDKNPYEEEKVIEDVEISYKLKKIKGLNCLFPFVNGRQVNLSYYNKTWEYIEKKIEKILEDKFVVKIDVKSSGNNFDVYEVGEEEGSE